MNAEVIPFIKPKQPEPKCSFCQTPRSKTKHFFDNGEGTKYICGACIQHAKERLNDSKE